MSHNQLIVPTGCHAKEFAGQPHFIGRYGVGTDIITYRIAVHQA